MTNLQNLTVGQLRKVVAIKEQIERLEAKLGVMANGYGAALAAGGRAPKAKRHMSRAARARIAAAQRARWAKVKQGGKGKSKPAGKAKRKVSAATRARLAAVAKARWAKVKASGKSTL
jgi:hypothetical protein